MDNSPQYTKYKLFDFIKHDALVSLYHMPLLREKANEISGTFSYLFGGDIKEAKLEAPLLAISVEKAQSIFTQVAYDVVQSFGLNHYTNPDLKSKDEVNVLIYSIKLDDNSAIDKIKNLSQLKDTAILLNFYNLDEANSSTVKELKNFLSQTHDNIFFGVESKKFVEDFPQLQAVQFNNVENTTKLKMK